jgi:adenine-specific DNA-methyltransferase
LAHSSLCKIFDYVNFRNEVVWCYDKWVAPSADFQKNHDIILKYSKTDDYYSNILRKVDEKRQLTLDRGYTTNLLKNGERQLIVYKGSENKENIKELIKSSKFARVIYKDPEGNPLKDYWLINKEHPKANERTGYPTQKPIELLLRIIETSCPKNGIILDAFMGSGTTCKAAELLVGKFNYTWIGIDNSKFAIHTARKRLVELNGQPKPEKDAGVYKVRPFTVENMGYYQRGVKWDAVQVGAQADSYRQAIIELFGGEYAPYSKLLHGKKRGSWIHVGPLSAPIVGDQIDAIAKEVKDTDFKKCYVLSADFTAHLNSAIEKAKEKYGVTVTARIIPASAIDEVKKRLGFIKSGVKNPEKISEMPNIAFFSPLTVKIHKVIDGKEAMIGLAGLEVDAESFLESQKPECRDELKKWLEKEKSWQSFVDFWAVDWDYESLKDNLKESVFENEWQSFRKRNGKKMVEDLVFKAFHAYEKAGEYTIAVKVTDVFGNDGIVTTKVVIKK